MPGARRRPDFFIVGAPKAGTTALYTYLRKHPDIFMPDWKEPHFFGTDHHFTHRPRHTHDWYESHFAGARDQKRVGEASTTYLHSKLAAKEIQEFNPGSRIIVMLRNPVDVMYALHSTNLYAGFEYITDFAKALDAEEKRKCGQCWPDRNGILELLFYREIATFTPQVRRYLDVFGPTRVHIIVYDDFERDTAGVYGRVLRFLDVAGTVEPSFPRVNANHRIRSTRVHNFLLHPPARSRALVRAVVPCFIRQAMVERLKRLNATEEPRQAMDVGLRRRLQAEFVPEVKRLGVLLGRDLSHWCTTINDGPGGTRADSIP